MKHPSYRKQIKNSETHDQTAVAISDFTNLQLLVTKFLAEDIYMWQSQHTPQSALHRLAHLCQPNFPLKVWLIDQLKLKNLLLFSDSATGLNVQHEIS